MGYYTSFSFEVLDGDNTWKQHYSNLVPYFEKALEIMETWDDSISEVPVIIN